MSKITLKYIHSYRDRHGRQRHYFRKNGVKTPLPGLPGSQEFMLAYQKALHGIDQKSKLDRSPAGSLDALITRYLAGSDYAGLADATKATYRRILDHLRVRHGHKLVADLEGRHVRNILDEKASTPAAANRTLSIFRILMRLAIARELRKTDPTVGIKKVRYKSSGFLSWTDQDIEKYERRWPVGTKQRLALVLLLQTGQRRSDVVRMSKQHVEGDYLRVVQQKTGTELELHMSDELKEAIAACPSYNLPFLVTEYGKQFTPAGFTGWFVDNAKRAGLSAGHTPHGLRKATARRLAEAGASANEIMAVTGHKNLREVTIYTSAANQKRMAETALKSISRVRKAVP
jgi:integrase